jgi:PAS domain S-box-containing protein
LLAWLLVFSLALTLGLLLWSAKSQDEIAVAGSRHLASTAVRVLQSNLTKTVTDYTYWDDAYRNFAQDFNPDWFDQEFGNGPYLSDTFGITASFIIGPDNRVLRHMHDSEIAEPGLEHEVGRHVDGGIEELIKQARRTVAGEYQATGGLVEMAGQIYVAAVRVIHPHSEDLLKKAAITPGNAYLGVFMRPLNKDLLQEIADDFGLKELTHVADADASGGVTLPLGAADGRRFGTLVWQIDRPSRYVFRIVLPGLLAVVLCVGLLGWYVLNNLRRAQVALMKREAQFKQAHEITRLGYWHSDPTAQIVTISAELSAILGMPRPRECTMPYDEYLERFVHADDRERVRKETGMELVAGAHFETEYRLARPEPDERWVREVGQTITGERGVLIGEAGTVQDVTEVKRSEERLRQAQKMEAVGQLTGGLAHDLNNLLAVVQGNAEFLAEQAGDATARLTRPILRATKRAAELTQRLLAFSRQQPLHPRAVDVAALVAGMTSLLDRTLGETIKVETVIDPDLWPAWADPSQIEDTLLNLAINARDAMTEGGKLTIECLNARLDQAQVAANPELKVGDYAVVAVSDTGTGMSDEVQSKAFEPFFTTKEVGQGSGLGLSMAYGFASQSGGHLTIYSEEGQGTTVRLYLPKAEGKPATDEAQTTGDIPRGRGEVVLVIEDNADVRLLVVKMLNGLGYQAVDVADAAAARAALREDRQTDLILSDVVLSGGTSGLQFAEEVRARDPGAKIIFMSGYTAEAAKRHTSLASDGVPLKKPFSMRVLATALRKALDS